MENRLDSMEMPWIKKIYKSKSFSAFTSALLAIVLGLIIGFIVMIVAKPERAIAALQKIIFY